MSATSQSADNCTPHLLDLRAAAAFEAGHPAGAVNIPLNDLAGRGHELPPPGELLFILCLPEDRAAAEALLAPGHPLRWLDPRHVAGPLETGPSGGRLWRPAALLAEWIDRLPRGRALDLGCGSGRDAVFLAEHGFEVTAVDRLPDALQRAEALAGRRGMSIRTRRADLRGGAALPEVGPFEVICCMYFLPVGMWSAVAEALSPGGMVLIEAFTEEHAARFGRPRSARRVVREGQLAAVFSGLDVLLDRRLWLGDRRHVCQLVARRP